MENFINGIVRKGKMLGDNILNNDLDATMRNHGLFNFKETVEKLEKDFNSAVYRGTYEAIQLEKECSDRLL